MNYKTILPYVLCIILGLLLARECNRDKTIIKRVISFDVNIPEIKADFDTLKDPEPIAVKEIDSLYKERYLNTKDSLERLKMYLEAITVREYKQTFEDSTQKIDIWSKTRGELLEQQVSYKIFPRTITVTDTIEIPQRRHFYLLPQAGYNPQDYKVKVSLSLIYQDRKKRLYSVGYDTQGFVLVGYGLKL